MLEINGKKRNPRKSQKINKKPYQRDKIYEKETNRNFKTKNIQLKSEKKNTE